MNIFEDGDLVEEVEEHNGNKYQEDAEEIQNLDNNEEQGLDGYILDDKENINADDLIEDFYNNILLDLS